MISRSWYCLIFLLKKKKHDMDSRTLIIINKINQLEQVQSFIEQIGSDWTLNDEMVFELNLILEEYITNLVNYGYHDEERHEIIIEISKEDNQLKMIVTDDAGPFNIMEVPENEDIDKPVEERRIGGLGIHFIRSLADQLEYDSSGGRNRLLIIKYFK
jgi:anti-sigma regulatory factor (Ser/Thr protein kinase)